MKFTKMHGAGNDYIFIDCLKEKVADPASLSRAMSDRHFGIGGDGIILILPAESADFRMRIFNADGSEAEMCGNGIRCVGKYVYDRKYTSKAEIRIDTLAGILPITLHASNGRVDTVTVDMGCPRLQRGEIPMTGPAGQVIAEEIEAGGRKFKVTAVSMGNPHCVIFVDQVENFEVGFYGPLIENYPVFPSRTNVEFVEILSRSEVSQRTWERGSGETWACGTGASATAVAGVLNGKTERRVTIHLRGGDLNMEWAENNHVYMTGPAVEVFSGEWLD